MSITVATLLAMFVVAVVPLAPTEPVVVSVGVLAALDHTSPLVVIAVAAVGCSLSDHLLYALGRLAGTRLLDRLCRKPATAAATEWLRHNSRRWGPPILVAGRWLPAGGTVGAVLAGCLGWRLPRFTPVSVVGSTLWSTYVVMVGYLGGSLTGQPLTGMLLSLAVAALLAVPASVFLRRFRRSLPQPAVAEATPVGV